MKLKKFSKKKSRVSLKKKKALSKRKIDGSKILKIKFVDFWQGSNDLEEVLKNVLLKYYTIIISDTPDLLIYSNFGNEYQNIKYNNCNKLYYNGENNRYEPRYNNCDIYLGYDVFNDLSKKNFKHYHWMIFLKDFVNYKIANSLIRKNIFNYEYVIPRDTLEILDKKKKFCCFLVSNGFCQERNYFFNELSKYKKVDSGGKLYNNIGMIVDREKTKEWISQYKFTITFENSSVPNYLTEKMIQSYSYNTIPIYWGDPNVENLVNSNCFINCHNFNNFSEVIEQIKIIDNNDELYLKIYNQPFFKDSNYLKNNKLDYIFDKISPHLNKSSNKLY